MQGSTSAERKRGLKWLEAFGSSPAVVENGGTIGGSPVIKDGIATFNGTTDYVDYGLQTQPCYSFIIEFLAATEITSTTPLNTLYSLTTDSDSMAALGNFTGAFADETFTIRASSSDYSTYIKTNIQAGRTQIAMRWNGSSYDIFVNGEQRTTYAGATGHFPLQTTPYIVLGARYTKAQLFTGKMYWSKSFSEALTNQEILDYANNSTYNYMNQATVILPMQMEDHDMTNVRTLDRSGNGNHFLIGDGSTSSTYPEKKDKAGYYWPGTTAKFLSFPSKLTFSGNSFTVSYWEHHIGRHGRGGFTQRKTTAPYNGVSMGKGGAASVNFAVIDSSGNALSYTPTEILHTEMHYAVTYNMVAKTMTSYVNGMLVDTDTNASMTNDFAEADAPATYLMSRDGVGTAQGTLTGGMRDLFVKMRELTPIQMYDLHIKQQNNRNKV